MGLDSASNIAQSGLNSVTAQIAVLTRNISGANSTSTYSTKVANVVTSADGGSQVASISRNQNLTLFENVLNATSSSATQTTISKGLEQLQLTIGATTDSTDAQSPATMLSNFTTALQSYESSPSDVSLANSAVSSASALATSLNSATTTVQGVREQADADMSQSVTQINSLLQQFQAVNTTIAQGTASGTDITDAEDTRDSILTQLSQQIGITTVSGPNNSMNIYTDSGVTLFQTTARTLTFDPTTSYTASTTGNAVLVDGVPITGSSATMPIQSGALAGLANLRDDVAVTYQSQLDSIAGGLISDFSETDQSGNGGPELPGLFTTAGATSMPASTTGLAGLIQINASVDPTQGGNAMLLRDGGISDTGNSNYTYNMSGDASYSGRIDQLLSNLSSTSSFSSSGGIGTSNTLSGYATDSISWLEGQRSTVSSASTYQNTLLSQATTALSSATGVNIDDQMSQMLNLENSYNASAKLMSTISGPVLYAPQHDGSHCSMTISSISTASLQSVLSQSVSSLQLQLANTELELSTGQDADTGLTLGVTTGQSISLQQQQSYLQTLTTTNNTAYSRLGTTQTVLSSVQTSAQTFLDSLIENDGSQTTAATEQTSATTNLQTVIANLNTQVSGSYIFAGTNTANAPITDYFGASSPNAASVNSAITAQFGSPPDFSTTTGADMTSFLDNQFSALFSGSNWTSNWSSASDQTLTSQVSTTDKESTSVSANETAFQQLAEAYTMMSSLGSQNLSSDAYNALTTKAQSLLSSAITGLTDIQTNVGTVQSNITSSNTQMSAQMSVFTTQISDLTSADAYDAATKVNNLQTQIETAFSLTNQLKQLSLVNYIS